MNKGYLSKIDTIEMDYFSKELQNYSLNLIAFGKWESNGLYKIENNSLPFFRFIFITNGIMEYESGGYKISVQEGDLIYTPAYTLYSATSDDSSNPSFTYLYFEIKQAHLIDNFTKLMSLYNESMVYRTTNSKIELYLITLFEEYTKKLPGFNIKCNYFLLVIVIEILRIKTDYPAIAINEVPEKANSTYSQILSFATNYIAEHIMDDLKVRIVANACNVSENYLYKIFISSLGIAPSYYIRKLKIEAACSQLKNTNKTITQIAEELHFSSANHLSNTFLEIVDIRPLAYRKKQNKIQISKI